MKLQLFTRKGFLYLPSHPIAWLIFIGAITCAIWLFIDIDSRSHSVSDTLINWVFNLIILGVAYTLIGFFTEKKVKNE